jgi:hypothetical protein
MGRPGAPRVEAVAARILNDCLIQDGSLLTPGVAIWRPTLGYSDSEIERMTLGLRPRAAIASIVVMTQ